MNQLGIWGHALAGIAWLVLAVLLAMALHRGSTRAARRLLIAVLAVQAAREDFPFWPVITLELARDAAWLYAVLGIAPAAIPRFLPPTAWGLLALWALACVFWRPLGSAIAAGGVAFALSLLLVLEQLYRNSTAVAHRHRRSGHL
jgi:hypothetical protein